MPGASGPKTPPPEPLELPDPRSGFARYGGWAGLALLPVALTTIAAVVWIPVWGGAAIGRGIAASDPVVLGAVSSVVFGALGALLVGALGFCLLCRLGRKAEATCGAGTNAPAPPPVLHFAIPRNEPDIVDFFSERARRRRP